MNKSDLIKKIAGDTGLTNSQANAAIKSFVEAIGKTLKGGGKVTIADLGTFSVTRKTARVGRNPQTGAAIRIRAKNVAKFKGSKKLGIVISKGGTEHTGPRRKKS